MSKVVRADGKVAVLYSPGYGFGWYTWNKRHPQCIFESRIVNAVESGDLDLAEQIALELYGDSFCAEGVFDLKIAWIDQGTIFEIHEYDGYETIQIFCKDGLIIAQSGSQNG